MKFTHQLTYQASRDTVQEMLTDPGHRERVCQVMRCQDYSVTEEGDTLVVKQVQRVRKVPAFATKVVGETVEIIQRERWVSDGRAEFEWQIPGKPGQVRGSIVLSETASGVTTETLSGEIKVNIPLIGGKLEGVVDGILQLALKAEKYAGDEWLAARAS